MSLCVFVYCHTSLFIMIAKNVLIAFDFTKFVRSFHESPFVSLRDYVTVFKTVPLVGMT